MRGFLFLGVLMAALIPGRVQGAVPEDTLKVERLDSVIVSTSRAGRSTPVAYTMVSKEDLRRTNPLNSLPMTLSLQPSVVSVNEGGTGIGYSKLTVRGWMNEKNSLKLTYLLGDQHSGITWNGISLSQYEEDRRYNSAGEYTDAYGNLRYYDNETDNYRQHHLQLNYTRQFTDALLWTTTFNYTRGDGYYENYKAERSSTKYGFDEKFYGDFIIREAMANDYFVVNSDLRFHRDRLSLTGGINLSSYVRRRLDLQCLRLR